MNNFQRSCRCCFERIEDINKTVKLTQISVNRLQELIQLELLIDKSLPELICLDCDGQLNNFIEFKSKVIETQQNIAALLSQPDVKIERIEQLETFYFPCDAKVKFEVDEDLNKIVFDLKKSAKPRAKQQFKKPIKLKERPQAFRKQQQVEEEQE